MPGRHQGLSPRRRRVSPDPRPPKTVPDSLLPDQESKADRFALGVDKKLPALTELPDDNVSERRAASPQAQVRG